MHVNKTINDIKKIMIFNKQKILIIGLAVTLLLVVIQFVIIDNWIIPALQQDLLDAHNIGYNSGMEDALTGLFQQTSTCQPTNIWIGNNTKQLIDVACLQIQESQLPIKTKP